MNQRERFLVGVVVSIVVLWLGWQGWQSYQGAYDRRVSTVDQLEEALYDQELEVLRGREARERLELLQTRSLPADADVARSAYADWLKDTIRESGLELDSVRGVATRRFDDAATELTFNAVASGPPEAVVRFLDAYYRLGVLHQLTNLQLRPADDTGERWRVVSLTSAALVVDGASREAGLPEEPREPPRLRLAEAAAYAERIGARNLFARYTPPPPPRPDPQPVARSEPRPEPPPFDDAKHAKLTGIVRDGAELQAWVLVRTTGEQLRLKAGDKLEVGSLTGTVKSVGPREMTVESEAGQWAVSLSDDTLRQAADDAQKAGS
ncbi:hypothetical protein [Botrimarina sp.]|uniref:hypothetical protein n=1 Tax=Botrimarina sp. TaxID=2795802 RepID=UPI0032EE89CA